jgi:hypothetical protein
MTFEYRASLQLLASIVGIKGFSQWALLAHALPRICDSLRRRIPTWSFDISALHQEELLAIFDHQLVVFVFSAVQVTKLILEHHGVWI